MRDEEKQNSKRRNPKLSLVDKDRILNVENSCLSITGLDMLDSFLVKIYVSVWCKDIS